MRSSTGRGVMGGGRGEVGPTARQQPGGGAGWGLAIGMEMRRVADAIHRPRRLPGTPPRLRRTLWRGFSVGQFSYIRKPSSKAPGKRHSGRSLPAVGCVMQDFACHG